MGLLGLLRECFLFGRQPKLNSNSENLSLRFPWKWRQASKTLAQTTLRVIEIIDDGSLLVLVLSQDAVFQGGEPSIPHGTLNTSQLPGLEWIPVGFSALQNKACSYLTKWLIRTLVVLYQNAYQWILDKEGCEWGIELLKGNFESTALIEEACCSILIPV